MSDYIHVSSGLDELDGVMICDLLKQALRDSRPSLKCEESETFYTTKL